MGGIFQKFDRIYNTYVVPKYDEIFSENHSQAWVNKWSTPTHHSTTIRCMQGQDFWIFFWCGFASKHAIWTYTCPQFFFVRIRLKIVNFFVVGIRLKTIIPMLHRCVFGPNPFQRTTARNSDHVLFIPTWMPKRVQDLDLRNEADCELLSYGAYVYALGCYYCHRCDDDV